MLFKFPDPPLTSKCLFLHLVLPMPSKTTALACENLVLALRAYGFDSCMMEGFDEPMVRELLDLNDQQYPVMVIGAGERAKDGVFFPQYRFDRELFIQKV